MRLLRDLRIRLLQGLALSLPGGSGLRVRLHRWRGVQIGSGVFISTDALIETAHPELVSIGNDVFLGLRATIIGHFNELAPEVKPGSRFSVRIEDQAWIGPGVIILPGVNVGRGAVVTAGSVVSGSVPELTVVQGNPARPVARVGVPLGPNTSAADFQRHLRPLRA
jgi:acetyltransferase-like isoleucine patch superfamily enzyme